MTSSSRLAIAAASLLCGACGYTARLGAGPTFTSDGRTGFEVGGELSGHVVGSKPTAIPVGLRVHLAWIDDDAIGFIGMTITAEAFPRFYRDDPGPGFAGRLGGSVGGIVSSPDTVFALRPVLAVGAGERRTSRSRWTRLQQVGAEVAWEGDFGAREMMPEETGLQLKRWRMTPAFYAQVSWQEAVRFLGMDL